MEAKRDRVAQWRRDVFESLSESERGQAARLLSRLAAAVEHL